MKKNSIVVSVKSLSRKFGKNQALKNVSLTFQEGCVHGIVGENGAGKSTLIKHMLGLYRAQKGSVSVFGVDPVKEPAQVLGQIGYVSEEPELPGWMTVSEYLNYMSAFYGDWDKQYQKKLVDLYELDLIKRTSQLSKGQRARVALCAAQAHRPKLLLLDEPSSGLDPIVRRDILNVAMETVKEDGRTVIFSSHFLEEVESVSEQLIMIKKGDVFLSDSLINILESHHRFTLKLNGDESIIYDFPKGISIAKRQEGRLEVDCFLDLTTITAFFKRNQIEILEQKKMNLSEVFFSRSKGTSKPARGYN